MVYKGWIKQKNINMPNSAGASALKQIRPGYGNLGVINYDICLNLPGAYLLANFMISVRLVDFFQK